MTNLKDGESLTLDWGEAFSCDAFSCDEGIIGPDQSKVSPYDALIQSVMNCGRVDLDYISGITGMDKDEIYISLGSPWIPPSVIDDFMEYLFQDTGYGPYTKGIVRRRLRQNFYQQSSTIIKKERRSLWKRYEI